MKHSIIRHGSRPHSFSARLFLLLALSALSLRAADAPKPLRALLIAGGCCHDYKSQKEILKKGIEARANIQVDIVYSEDTSTKARFDIYEKPDWAKGYDVIIHDECSADVKDMPYVQNILNAHKEIPAVNLHCAMHCYRTGPDDWFKFIGIQSSAHGPQEPISLHFVDADHPITKGMTDWTTIREELYNNIKIFDTAHALARGKQTVKQKDGTSKDVEYVVAWINQYGNSRVFSTTIGHNNETVRDERYLALVTRGLLWACGKLNDQYLKAYVAPIRRTNLAKNKPAKASSEETGKENFAARAFDGDAGTRWCASGPSEHEWLQVDLGAPAKITGARIAWEFEDVPYYHRIEGSSDGETWKLLYDRSKNSDPGPSEDDFSANDVRFLRVVYLGKPGGGWGSIYEVEVYGDKTEEIDPGQEKRAVEQKYLSDIKVPEGFDATIFAAPPLANYPVFLSAAPDGTVFVSSDGNGSLGRDPHRGRILRLRDLDGDGHADEVKEFVKDVDSPRGLVWDHDRLYLLHPPHISMYVDKDGDGIADQEKILVKNIAFTFKDRPADHTSNGMELGVDGWLYCAIGDFGFMEAEGTDGRKVQLRGGGVVRVRPDGTGLEVYAHGTRNILEVAVSPLLDCFERDNTNDGGGWDVRFHHSTGLANHGYPSLFKNFADEIVQPLADYGGGSGCGACWIDEPGIPEKWNNAPFTADWGRSWIYRHGLTPKGATYTADSKEFLAATRVTDIEVDALSHIYVSSWKGATFNWVGPNVGYIVRLSPKGYTPEPLPEFDSLSNPEVVKLLSSKSHRRRLEAQRTLLRRGLDSATADALLSFAKDNAQPIPSRVAAIFAISQGLGEKASPALIDLGKELALREYAIRALADRQDQTVSAAALQPILTGLADSNPRVRLQSAVALAHIGSPSHAEALTSLLGDSDPIVSHTAVQALISVHGSEACFVIIDQQNAPTAQRVAALQVVQSLHDPLVVDHLVARLHQETAFSRREGLLTALCRLYFRQGNWKGDSWSTRPDTSGPYYQPETWSETPKISRVLNESIANATGQELTHLIREFNRHKIQSPAAIELIITQASKDPSLVSAAIGLISRADAVPSNAISLLSTAAIAPASSDITRAEAVSALVKSGDSEALRSVITALDKLENSRSAGTERERRLAREAFLNSSHLPEAHVLLVTEAAALNSSSVFADAALLKICSQAGKFPEAAEAAKTALDKGWNNSVRRAQILRAVQLVEYRPYKDKVLDAMSDNDPQVASAAKSAARALRIERAAKTSAQIGTLNIAEAISAVITTHGDLKIGEQLFSQQGCVNCHTVRADESPRGPFLGTIAATYKRAELAEAILIPNKTIAQGFVANHFELKDGAEYDGFVTLEAADKVVIRNTAAQEITIKNQDIAKREKLEKSLMPEGLAANLTLKEFASLLDYLENLAKK
jgi:putative membrane-bound dehydrogenase-like protein